MVTDVEDEMCWWQLKDDDEGFSIGVGVSIIKRFHQDRNSVCNIQKLSSTASHQHHCHYSSPSPKSWPRISNLIQLISQSVQICIVYRIKHFVRPRKSNHTTMNLIQSCFKFAIDQILGCFEIFECAEFERYLGLHL